MTIKGMTSTLEERGVVWQGVGFALIGAASLPVLWVYSEADHWSIGVYRLAVTQLSWAFVVAIALTIEGVRKMFETRTEIRRAARERAIAKAREKGERTGEQRGERTGEQRGERIGEQRATDRMKSILLKHGVELPPEAEEELFENGDGRGA